VTVLLKASFAVTEKLNELPATVDAGTEEITREVAPEEATEMDEEFRERLPSPTVMIRFPVDLRVMLNVPVPFVRVDAAGRTARGSFEEVWMLPVYPVATLLLASFAVTPKVNALPAKAIEGMEARDSCVAGPGFTVTVALEATGIPDIEAPSVTLPELIPVNVELNVPEPESVVGVRVPDPPTRLALKEIEPLPGRPVGFRFPKASLGVRVTAMVWPETTVGADTLISLFEVEKIAGDTVTGELVMLKVPSLAVRVWAPEVRRVAGKVAVPLIRVGVEGRTAFKSDDVKVGDPV
jgi:hypothetical protein